jgi:hypothetical protein
MFVQGSMSKLIGVSSENIHMSGSSYLLQDKSGKNRHAKSSTSTLRI